MAPIRLAPAQVANPAPSDSDPPEEGLTVARVFLGYNLGGGTLLFPGKEELLPVDFDGVQASGYAQTSGLYGHVDVRYDKLDVRRSNQEYPSFSWFRMKGTFLASVARGKLGGLAAGLHARYAWHGLHSPYGVSYLKEKTTFNDTFGDKLKETATLGALLALHSSLASSAKLIVMGGGFVERQATTIDLPLPQLLAGSMAGVHADLPLGPSLRVHLRGDAGARLWSSPYSEAGTTGEVVRGIHWDVTVRLSVEAFAGMGLYGSLSSSRRDETVRFREARQDVGAEEDFMSTLSVTVGVVFRADRLGDLP